MVQLDSAHDAIMTLMALADEQVDFIVKWNRRAGQSQRGVRLGQANQTGQEGLHRHHDGNRRATYKDEDGKENTIQVRRVLRATERYFERDGTPLLVPDVELGGWWTNLSVAKEKVIELYKGHALCEQYHSELKSDMNLKRFPSGKFATNALVMSCSALAYNILLAVGQIGLMGKDQARRARRRRIKTVMQDLTYCAARLIRHARGLTLRFSCHHHNQAAAYTKTYARFAYS